MHRVSNVKNPGQSLSGLLLAAVVGGLVSTSASADPRGDAIDRAKAEVARNAGQTHFGAEQGLTVRDVILDADGSEHVRFDRTYKGLPVIGGDFVTHLDAAKRWKGISQTLAADLKLPIRASVTLEEATSKALQSFTGSDAVVDSVKRVIYARQTQPVLAYDVWVKGMRKDGTPSELHLIIDAIQADILDQWDDIKDSAVDGAGSGLFNGAVSLKTDLVSVGVYALRDPSRGNQYTLNMNNKQVGGSVFTDNDNIWGNGGLSDVQTVGVDAQYGTSVTWDYYQKIHGRNGIRKDGVGAYNRVHYNRKYNNAFWSDSCFCMTYGDGDGTTFYPFDSLDVAGHEMSHGVTSRSANLTYSGESGGLNEATSDIFGTMVEYYAKELNPLAGAKDIPDYLIGEMLYISGAGKALRYMQQPSKDGKSPDCWSSTLGSLDVHYSSGVANHFFYLLAEGSGSGATASPICNVGDTLKATGNAVLQGIGRKSAERIWYRALDVYMTSATKYRDAPSVPGARTSTLNAADDLFGAGSPESNAVAAAWTAVNVQ